MVHTISSIFYSGYLEILTINTGYLIPYLSYTADIMSKSLLLLKGRNKIS